MSARNNLAVGGLQKRSRWGGGVATYIAAEHATMMWPEAK